MLKFLIKFSVYKKDILQNRYPMKRLLILLSLLLSFGVQSQQLIPLNEKPYLDSLQSVIKSNGANTAKANASFLLSNYYRNIDSLLSKKYLENGKTFIKGDDFLSAKYNFYEAQYNLDRNKGKAAISYQKAIKQFSKFKNEESDLFQAAAWYSYGVTQKDKEGYPFLVKTILEKSIPLAKKYENSRNLGFLYTQLAVILTYNAEFKKSEDYNTKALQILEKHYPNSPELFFTYLNLANNFCYQAKGDEAKKFLDKAETLIEPHPDSSVNAFYYYGKTLYYITRQKNPEALPVIEKGIYYAKKFNQNLLAQMFYFNKYDILRKLKRYNDAKNVLEDVLTEKSLALDLNNRKTIYKQLSSLHEEMGNTKQALIWEQKYSKLNDSLNTENVKLEINKIESKFNAAEKERKIATLNSEKKQKELEVNKKNSYLWGLSLFLLLVLSLLIFLYIIFRKNKKISEQKINDIKQKEELSLTKAILDGEERERERIARDLHDGLGGMLAGVKINFSTWSASHLDPEKDAEFYRILGQLDNSVSELRHVARNLMPESLLNFGLETALNDLCEFYSRKDMDIDFQAISIEKNLPINIQLNIYRIVQELLANAIKHAEASSILLQCSQSEKDFFITIEDNGKGFESNREQKTKSMGLHNLKNRVDYLKGNMEISSDSQGTTINIELNIDGD
ncbi:tetratricopeptide repeat-containing sensor histidine kinase [Chryseobacterium sp. BIGb0232]|uniref:tetratricopeptide repeat-containing sensor histidine kinase n=1 Tax=Chryseobacterium sp. BIGb0232 TaxID=2940598 RepID=UPI000F4903CD|nr:tetratricopeptide repeat-containing sensor histidine kinase [Chryseobacterium sp. BIGb0232]MCS4304824.1 signal transduction histidine kinase [Chryseobacterium sp. BIGb0232]ROS09748.1 histidine kinase/DNA gyrase B/HSP90-like ATPase [Chryseobacterium nakagawai]